MTLETNLTSLCQRLASFAGRDMPNEFYEQAVSILRGSDGGQHGWLLYKLIGWHGLTRSPVTALDVGTARGFSALAMARAMLDHNLSGRVYTVDVVGHDELTVWHGRKHAVDDALRGMALTRAQVWQHGFENEAKLVTPIRGASTDILRRWQLGLIDVAFVDGSHTYENVRAELEALDAVMARSGWVVVDDYHLGSRVARVESRYANALGWLVGKALGTFWPGLRRAAPRPGDNSAYLLVKQRFAGVRRAVDEFAKERADRWTLEIVSMPSRGAYQGDDYALALLRRNAGERHLGTE